MEGTETGVMTGLSTAITTAFETITSLMNSALDLAVGNPLVMIFVASGLIGIAIAAFQKLKRVAE